MTEVARATSERGELVLRRRAEGVLELRANGVFVMDTEEVSTERLLATASLVACERPAHVLVGGLGLGFTLAAVLDDARVERCTVVEIEPDLVGWLRDGVVPHGPALLDDDRVRVVVDDVAAALRGAAPGSLDLVLLDVDNGPAYLVHDANADLYRAPFLADVAPALRPGGVLAVWSADRSPALAAALEATFGACEEQGHVVRPGLRPGGEEERYWVYLARVASNA